MDESNSNLESIGIGYVSKVRETYKSHVFSMEDRVENIRDLVIKMSKMPLPRSGEQHDSK